ncbi:MAG: NAD(+) synthase [Oscillospiraceae bacterium]|jgi:NAD+ synthase (glutamine-hydrolysing)|nr:NAD(+) synthase [Oscillospiraceae bacterium]
MTEITRQFGFVKVAAISPLVTVGDPTANAQKILEAINLAARAGVQVMALPELCVSGYTCGDLFQQALLLDACEGALRWLMEQTQKIAALIAFGLPVRNHGRLYNCAAVTQSGKLLGVVPKEYIPNAREYYEKRWFAPADTSSVSVVSLAGQTAPFGRVLFDCGGSCTVGVELCEDLWAPSPPSNALATQGAEIILNLSASNEEVAKNEYRRQLVAQQSGRLRCAYVYAGAGVGESSTDLLFSGACFVAENGQIITETRRFVQEGSAVYTCADTELLRAERRFGTFYDRPNAQTTPAANVVSCAELPPLLPEHLTRKYSQTPFVPAGLLLRGERCRDIFDIQTAALVKRLRHTKLNQVILGLSGGLDSTLALLVALQAARVLAWKPEQIIGITMPGFGTSARTRQSVEELAEAFGITLWEIDIRPACELHMQDIGHNIDLHDVTYENVQARERTQILMDLANQEGALLLGTGDLSELALGFCTYNADHMSMYHINAGVPKTLVRHLVEFMLDEGTSPQTEALRRVLDTPVSPELLPPDEAGNMMQITEDIIGKYEVHDFYLYHFFRFGFRPQKLFWLACSAFDGVYTPDQLKKWLVLFLRRFFAQQFKRSCMPDGPKVGSVSLSPRGDWRMPSDASAVLWLDEAESL